MNPQRSIPTLFGRGTAIFKEHDDLRPMIARLREYATSLALGWTRSELDVEPLLDRFFDQLLAHFAAEENEGYFGTLVEDYPDLSVHVERLMTEHEEMVDAVERLRVLAEQPARTRDLGLGLLELVTRFEGHEQQESILMRRFISK